MLFEISDFYDKILCEMRKLFASLLCLITMPAVALDDACTKPKEFTVDKRCYVTSAQKKQKPFNATVALIDYGLTYCTGTIIKGFNGYNNTTATAQDKDTIFLYTAKHCTDNDGDGQPDRYLDIWLQNGDKYKAEFAYAGDYDIGADKNWHGDYALYKIPNAKSDIPYTTVRKWGTNGFNTMDARVIGYGSLKIMSDAEISDFRYKYLKFLGTLKEADSYDFKEALKSGETGLFLSAFRDELRKTDFFYWLDLFLDNEGLKVSQCKYFSNGGHWNCQTWNGNSGGGIFDNAGNLIGILTRGAKIIGGESHSGADMSRDNKPFVDDFYKARTIPIAF